MSDLVLDVKNLTVRLPAGADRENAIEGISLQVKRGEIVCIVGESGSGKSVSAFTVMGLLPKGDLVPTSGEILLEGEDLLKASDQRLRQLRGTRMAMIFQEPMTALNPVITVGDQIAEVARVHAGTSRREAMEMAVEKLRLVGIPEPKRRASEYPHQLSGGMRQRVMIAMALMMDPALLIADEPTTALDVTIQAQILELLAELQQRFGVAMLLITHDLGVIAETASRVIVMYAGEVVEEASVEELFARPHHPYTEGLHRAIPRLGGGRERLATIPGTVPAPNAWPTGCRFHDRCPYAWERCATEHPPLYQIGAGHTSRCHLADEPERREHPHPPLVVQRGAA